MPYFAALLARGSDGWTARELDLDDIDDVATLADRLHELGEDAQTVLLFIEEDDEYVAIVRADTGDDPRIFVSDASMAEESRIAEMLVAETVVSQPPVLRAAGTGLDVGLDVGLDAEPQDGSGDEDLPEPSFEPAGDPDVVADFGVPARELLALCAHEGRLPADVIAAVCERAGCLPELEEIREA